MRRDYVDWLGDYIPRGQPHFRLWPTATGGQRLSLRSMQIIKAAADHGELVAIQILRGEMSDSARRALLR